MPSFFTAFHTQPCFSSGMRDFLWPLPGLQIWCRLALASNHIYNHAFNCPVRSADQCIGSVQSGPLCSIPFRILIQPKFRMQVFKGPLIQNHDLCVLNNSVYSIQQPRPQAIPTFSMLHTLKWPGDKASIQSMENKPFVCVHDKRISFLDYRLIYT